MPDDEKKRHRFTMVMTDEQHRRLEAIAAAERRSSADLIRLWIDDTYKEMFGKPAK